MSARPAFALADLNGETRAFPSGRPALVCFVKEDCPTCNLVMPILKAFQVAHGEAADILVLGQTAVGNQKLQDQYALPQPILDESGCTTSFAWDIDTVPSAFWTDGEGRSMHEVTGFVREEWKALAETMGGEAEVDWAAYPEWRPGCGSKHLDPEVNDRLRAEAEGSPIRSRRIEIASADDVHEFLFDQGFSDGLPLIPPTPERVMRMLDGTHRGAQDVVAEMPPNMGPATVEKIAINAVMAGCKPEYLPVVIAAVEAVCTDAFNMHGVLATTMGASPVIVVNGPIRERIGMNMKLAALGAGNRANATIGRALRLIVRNVGGAKPEGVERSTLSNPMKYTMCFAEWEERSPWEPLHVERGFKAEDSVVTVFAMTSGPTLIVDQESREPDQIAGSLGLGLEGVFLPKAHMLPVDALLVVCPEHLDTLMSGGAYSKARLRQRIQEVTQRPMREMLRDARSGAGLPPAVADTLTEDQLDSLAPKFRDESYIHIAVAGSDAGKFSGAFHGWATGPIGSVSVSRKIEVD
ncbi:MAG: TlpA family protein disulfide reductase [Pseudomonadota bacterium]